MANLPPKWRYTTHKQHFVTVHYFLHSLRGKEVQVLRELNFSSEKVYLVQFSDAVSIHLPAWMADPDYCSSCKVQEQPEVSLNALCNLRKLLDGLEL